MALVFVVFFTAAVAGALIGLALLDVRAVPPITGTTALILTLAALAAAVLR